MLSFVLPAYNEALLIADTIGALHAGARECGLDEAGYEIVVADDASEDETGEIATSLGARVVRVEHRQIAATRNAGARAARGERLVFVDADTHVPAALIRATLEAFESGVPAGGSSFDFDEPVPQWAGRLASSFRWFYRRARLTPGAYLFCTREAWHATGGFDESRYGGEEVLFAWALGRYSKRQGRRFTILPQRIVTSARKLRTYSPREILTTLLRVGLSGARSRRGMELWYGRRRDDPKQGPIDADSGRSPAPVEHPS